MELHERAQFDFLVNTAAERFVERLVQRTGGLGEGLGELAVRAFADVLAVKVDQGIERALSGHLG